MELIILTILGLAFGSFVNALVWRLHEQSRRKKPSSTSNLSIVNGRSICPHCHRRLAAADLVPVLSWLYLKGKCRYCGRPIGWQYPVVEVIMAVLFALSYVFWPSSLAGAEIISFGLWLALLIGLVALVVYDLRWMLLPNRIIYPLFLIAGLQLLIKWLALDSGTLASGLWGVLIGGGIFYILFQVSQGRWIGGGDVKLGALLGLIVGGPFNGLVLLFVASTLGTLVSLPLLATKRVNRHSRIPFGPFLIIAGIIVNLFGTSLVGWYSELFLPT